MRRRSRPDVEAAEALALLRTAGATLATAESLTGGRLAAAVTSVPGASASYLGGFVTYATELKESLLGVPRELVEQYGVVSGECASAMAAGLPGRDRRDVRRGDDGCRRPRPAGGQARRHGLRRAVRPRRRDRARHGAARRPSAASRTGRVGRRCRRCVGFFEHCPESPRAAQRHERTESVGTHRRQAPRCATCLEMSWGTTPTRVAFPPQPPFRPQTTRTDDPGGPRWRCSAGCWATSSVSVGSSRA